MNLTNNKWTPDTYKKFMEILCKFDMIEKTYYEERITSLENSIKKQVEAMQTSQYKDQMQEQARMVRDSNPIDYYKLLMQGMVPYKENPQFDCIREAQIRGIKSECDYYG